MKNKYTIGFDQYTTDRYYVFLRSQSIKKIFKGEQVDKSYKAYKKSKWYTPVTDSNIAYAEYLYDKLDSYINYSEYLSGNTYIDTSDTIIIDSNYTTYCV